MLDDQFSTIQPVNFFSLQWDCHYLEKPSDIKHKRYLLPDTSMLCQEESFADIYMGWNFKGLIFLAMIHTPFKDVFYPDIRRGDSLELFIDTRDVKTTGFNTKFCHQFFFLPHEIEGTKMGESTRFRTEDRHDLCDAQELHLQSDITKKGYTLKIFIPASCLYGYDPDECNHLGFTYRVNRWSRPSQHFAVVSDEFAFEQQPALWARIDLKK